MYQYRTEAVRIYNSTCRTLVHLWFCEYYVVAYGVLKASFLSGHQFKNSAPPQLLSHLARRT